MLECICWAGGILGFQEIQRLDTQARKVPAIEMQPHFSRASEPPPPGRHNGRAGGADEGVGGQMRNRPIAAYWQAVARQT
jgi:hypothetical protein